MAYRITNYTKAQAKKLGVSVRASSVKGKKTDDLSKDPPKSPISYFFTRIANSGDLLIIFLKKYPTFTTKL